MVLATKLKNVKSNPLIKILTAVISVLLCIVFCINSLPIIEGLSFFGNNLFDGNCTIYDSVAFRNNLYYDVDILVENALKDDIAKKYNAEKDKFIKSALADFKASQEFYNSDADAINNCLVDNYDYSEGNKYDSNYISEKYNLTYEDETIKFSKYYYAQSSFYYDEKQDVENFNSEEIYVSIDINITDEKKVNNYLEYQFNNYYHFSGISNSRSLSEIIASKPFESKTISYYLKAKSGNVTTNVDNVDILKADTKGINTIIISDGDVVTSELTNKAYCYGESQLIDGIEEGYIQFNVAEDNDDVYSDIYVSYINISNKLDNMSEDIIVCALCILLLIVLLCFQCSLAGYRQDGVKTIFVDKVPNDLHFVLTAGVITGLALLVLCILEEYISAFVDNNGYGASYFITSGLYRPAFYALVSAMWLAVVELCTSFARQIKTKSSFWKNNLFYLFGKNCIAKPVNKIKAKEYSPNYLKKEVIAAIIAYSIINIFGIISTASFAHSGFIDLTILVLIALLIIDVVVIVFVAKYLINLDIIITAIHNRQMPNVNYDKLPKSLKALVDSQRITNDELNKAITQAVKDERMRAELITNVSHDLKTPLTSIITYVDLLKQCDIDDKNAKEYIGVLDEKGGRLKRLIDDLIEASKITSGVVTLNPVELDLSELATQAVVEHQQEFADNNLELVFKGDKHSQMTYADGTKTYRIIENLLSNARKYSAKGSRVYADVYEANNASVFEIKNISATPLDITPDELMERFVRGDKSRNQEGNGLGLSIADNLCKAMNGKLEISIDGDLFKAKVFLPKTK